MKKFENKSNELNKTEKSGEIRRNLKKSGKIWRNPEKFERFAEFRKNPEKFGKIRAKLEPICGAKSLLNERFPGAIVAADNQVTIN